jgi:hypothetical protein
MGHRVGSFGVYCQITVACVSGGGRGQAIERYKPCWQQDEAGIHDAAVGKIDRAQTDAY